MYALEGPIYVCISHWLIIRWPAYHLTYLSTFTWVLPSSKKQALNVSDGLRGISSARAVRRKDAVPPDPRDCLTKVGGVDVDLFLALSAESNRNTYTKSQNYKSQF